MLDWPWAEIAGVGVILLASLAGIVLTVLTLPGTWVPIVAGAIVKIWMPDLVPWWVLIAAVVVATLAEVIEFVACALGASRGGATRRGVWGAVLGSFFGALVGSVVPPFPLGTILGGVIGAALGTLAGDRSCARGWGESGRAAAGAAVGRAVATLTKTALAGVIAAGMSIAAVVGAVA
jgi:uncharacterized protein YqgC (DUF456 family)